MTPESGIESARQGELTLPDYRGGGLVNLMSSIATALGGTSPYPPAAALPPEALAGARHLVLLVIDGLGHDFLLGRDSALRRHLRSPLTSVFPSTTASAIPTFLTGLAPQQHGLTGWHMYFREIGAIAAPLPFRVRAGRHALREAGVTPASLFGLTPLFDRLPLPSHVVSPRHIIHSDFNVALSGRARRHGYETLDEMFALIAGSCCASKRRAATSTPTGRSSTAWRTNTASTVHRWRRPSPRSTPASPSWWRSRAAPTAASSSPPTMASSTPTRPSTSMTIPGCARPCCCPCAASRAWPTPTFARAAKRSSRTTSAAIWQSGSTCSGAPMS
jgi:hypothetical protein